MKVCVAGMWHLGSVTAACLASAGHVVVGFDEDRETTSALQGGVPPVGEPGLSELVVEGVRSERLRFSSDATNAVSGAEILWITYDTPVDEDDRADVDSVLQSVARLVPLLETGSLVVISSQVPVGSTRSLEQMAEDMGRSDLSFAYSPENLRLGKAIEVFTRPDRVVVGVRDSSSMERIVQLLAPYSPRIEWMSVESAEMTKHALNAFLATSVAFINEIGAICERVGADARQVERGLKTESRIGPRAYLGPGGAFAGGTLARDVVFLSSKGSETGVPTHLINGVKSSNDAHKGWALRRLDELVGLSEEIRVAIWGLTYKPGTDTLRRSSAIELCRSLVAKGVQVVAHDPAVRALPEDLAGIRLVENPMDALDRVSALVVQTEWQDYLRLEPAMLVSALEGRLVLDANRFLVGLLGEAPGLTYVTVGKAV